MSLSRVDSSRSSASRIIQREPIFFTEASFSVFAGRESAPRTCACTGDENSRESASLTAPPVPCALSGGSSLKKWTA